MKDGANKARLLASYRVNAGAKFPQSGDYKILPQKILPQKILPQAWRLRYFGLMNWYYRPFSSKIGYLYRDMDSLTQTPATSLCHKPVA
jgi:hypothetical protein